MILYCCVFVYSTSSRLSSQNKTQTRSVTRLFNPKPQLLSCSAAASEKTRCLWSCKCKSGHRILFILKYPSCGWALKSRQRREQKLKRNIFSHLCLFLFHRFRSFWSSNSAWKLPNSSMAVLTTATLPHIPAAAASGHEIWQIFSVILFPITCHPGSSSHSLLIQLLSDKRYKNARRKKRVWKKGKLKNTTVPTKKSFILHH